jgi:hypothetical protein
VTVKRYDPIVNVSEPDVREHPNGDYVEYDDYASLQSRLDKAEAERDALRGMVERAQAIISTSTYPNWHEAARTALGREG